VDGAHNSSVCWRKFSSFYLTSGRHCVTNFIEGFVNPAYLMNVIIFVGPVRCL